MMKGDRYTAEQVCAVTLQNRMWAHADESIEIAWRRAGAACIAFAR